MVFSLFALRAQAQEVDSVNIGVVVSKNIVPYLSYVTNAGANVSGGISHTSSYAGQLYAGLKFDLGSMLGWNGTRAKISMANRHGQGLMNAIGSVFEPLNVVGGQNTFLYDLSFEKDFGGRLSIKIGRTTAADDFSGSPLYFYSLNNPINGVIRALLLDGLMSTFPFPTWGARLKYKPNSNHQLQLGTYQMGEDIFDDTRHGLDFAFRRSDNLSLFFQYDWFGKVTDRDARIYLGIHQAFGTFTSFDVISQSDYFVRFYGHADAELVDGLRSFITMTYSPHGEIAKVQFQSSIGLNWKGLIKSRTDDCVLFFTNIGNFSDEWGALLIDKLLPEVVLELDYRFQFSNNFWIQPSLQYDIRPGGSKNIDDAFILGLLIEANF